MSVSAALAELGSREALIALAVNGGAEIADFSLRRMIERFGSGHQRMFERIVMICRRARLVGVGRYSAAAAIRASSSGGRCAWR